MEIVLNPPGSIDALLTPYPKWGFDDNKMANL